MTLAGTTGTLYVNGTVVATNAAMTLRPSSLGATGNDWLGRSQFGDPYLTGAIDEFHIYDRALDPAEVQALASGEPGPETLRRTGSTRRAARWPVTRPAPDGTRPWSAVPVAPPARATRTGRPAAGAVVPLKFSLGADLGLSVVMAGYPRLTPVYCGTTTPSGPAAWRGTCGRLDLRLSGGTTHSAYFSFP